MTWSEFNTEVRKHLTAHNRRQGIQTLIDALIKAGVQDLQSAIPELRHGHTTTYAASRFTADGYAAKAHYPPGATITAAFAVDPDDESKTFDFRQVTTSQEERDMVTGATGNGERLISLRPTQGIFRVVPSPINDESEVVLVYDAMKVDFEDDDDVPFDESAALVVSDFVQARLARQIEGDIASAQSFMGSFLQGKRRIKSDKNEAGLLPARAKRS